MTPVSAREKSQVARGMEGAAAAALPRPTNLPFRDDLATWARNRPACPENLSET